MSNNKAFCARPGCGIAYALHNRIAPACAGYIAPDSAAGRAIRKADKAARLRLVTPLQVATVATSSSIPPLCPTCGGRTDGVKPEPSFTGMRVAACDCEPETVEIDPPSDAELLADWQRTGEML